MSIPTERVPKRDCGLYRTTTGHSGHEDHLGPGLLVTLHDHRPEAEPVVHFPEANVANRWSFARSGHPVDDAVFLAALEPLRPEGLYLLREHLHAGDEGKQTLPERALVMLGYNRSGEPILFPATLNGLTATFPERGLRFETLDVLARLDPVQTAAPEDAPPPDRLVH